MILPVLLLIAAGEPSPAVPTIPAPVPAAPAIAPVKLAAWTPVRLATQAAIDSRSIRQGQRFALTVDEDVMAGSQIVIPRGTPAVGEVETLSEKSSGGKGAQFALTPLFIDWRGERIYLRGRREEKGKSQVTAAAVTTALITPLGVLISGKSASLPAGSRIDAEIRSDVIVVPAGL